MILIYFIMEIIVMIIMMNCLLVRIELKKIETHYQNMKKWCLESPNERIYREKSVVN